jgi:phage antirepressor YoqD-like protein
MIAYEEHMLSLEEMGKIYGVGDETIYRWLLKHGIVHPRAHPDHKKARWSKNRRRYAYKVAA